ncbi:MAG: N-acetyltransferase [Bacteroidia bacterium]|nr:N-acetyltransferase [Bacteroidia bacterium]
MLKIRKADIKDVPAIREIYNQAVLRTSATFDTEPYSLQQKTEWYNNHEGSHPVLVGEVNNTVVGWSSLSEWSGRCAYDGTVELSVYIDESHRGKGYGKQLTKAIVEAGRGKFHTILSRITEGNDSSLHIHYELGFVDIGVMKQVGNKFGKFLDVHMLQLLY